MIHVVAARETGTFDGRDREALSQFALPGPGVSVYIRGMSRLGASPRSSSPASLARRAPRRPFLPRPVPAPPEVRVALANGGSAALSRDGQSIEVRDARGALIVRTDGTTTEVCAPSGDLKLSAPEGRVIVESGADVVVSAGRDVVHHARRAATISAGEQASSPAAEIRVTPDRIAIQGRRAEVVLGAVRSKIREIETIADRVDTAAREVLVRAAHVETRAERWIQESRASLRKVTDVAEEEIGRVRSVVREAFSLFARRVSVEAEEEASIDGKRVLLG